jgi:hypothetical protein
MARIHDRRRSTTHAEVSAGYFFSIVITVAIVVGTCLLIGHFFGVT